MDYAGRPLRVCAKLDVRARQASVGQSPKFLTTQTVLIGSVGVFGTKPGRLVVGPYELTLFDLSPRYVGADSAPPAPTPSPYVLTLKVT